jgi:CRISPR/Cas system CMR subunit Cmr6 (Cas7 group RAMP superfamily)
MPRRLRVRELTLKDLLMGELGQQIKQSTTRIEKEKQYIKNINLMRRIMKSTSNSRVADRLKEDNPEKLKEYLELLNKVNKKKREKEEKQVAELKKLVDSGKIIGIEKTQVKTKLRKKLKRLGIGEDSYTYLEDKKDVRKTTK